MDENQFRTLMSSLQTMNNNLCAIARKMDAMQEYLDSINDNVSSLPR